MTFAEVADLPATVGLKTAAHALGIGMTTAYLAANAGEFPVPVFRAGPTANFRVPTIHLVNLLGVSGLLAEKAS